MRNKTGNTYHVIKHTTEIYIFNLVAIMVPINYFELVIFCLFFNEKSSIEYHLSCKKT